MADHHLASISEFEHPAPHRERVTLVALLYGLFAAPLAWASQLLVNYALVSYVCFGRTSPDGLGVNTVWSISFAVGLVALVLAATGALVTYRSWTTTRHETKGKMRNMVDIGHGRTRFLSMWGMMTSLGFLLAIVFGLVGFFVVPLCGS